MSSSYRAPWPLLSTCVVQKSCKGFGRAHVQARFPLSVSFLFSRFLDNMMTLNSGCQSQIVGIFLSVSLNTLVPPDWSSESKNGTIPSSKYQLLSCFCLLVVYSSGPVNGLYALWQVIHSSKSPRRISMPLLNGVISKCHLSQIRNIKSPHLQIKLLKLKTCTICRLKCFLLLLFLNSHPVPYHL